MHLVDSLIRDLEKVRNTSPLIHNITNYVVMNNTANALLSIGASPVMAHSIAEVEDMAGIASALVLNIGTLEPEWVKAMLLAGKIAAKRNIPLVFDPVGAGATPYRNRVCKQIIAECNPTIIRGNASEILALNNHNSNTKGVDSVDASSVAVEAAQALAEETGAIVAISGQTDYITDGRRIQTVTNGNPMMAKVTGMGCTASAIVAAFAAVNPDFLQAAQNGMYIMGIAGEIAAAESAGNGSLQVNFLDQLYNINAEIIKQNIKL